MLGPELHTIHQLQSNQRFAQLQHDIQLFYSMSQPMKPSIPNTLSTLSTCAISFRELWTLGSHCLEIPAVYFYVLPELWISQRTSLRVKFHISLFCLTFPTNLNQTVSINKFLPYKGPDPKCLLNISLTDAIWLSSPAVCIILEIPVSVVSCVSTNSGSPMQRITLRKIDTIQDKAAHFTGTPSTTLNIYSLCSTKRQW